MSLDIESYFTCCNYYPD